MAKRITTAETTDSIKDAFKDEDEFNDSLENYPDPIEVELGVDLRHIRREHPVDYGSIDIFGEIHCTDSDSIVIETQIGQLNDDHISRAYKYMIQSGATVLIYIADKFSAITKKQLNRMNENDDAYIFGFSPSITPIDGDTVDMRFRREVAPNDWEEYKAKNLPDGLDKDRAMIFDYLEDELKDRNLPLFTRQNPVPKHSGYGDKSVDLDGFYLYYSVKRSVQTESIEGESIDNINLRIQTDDDRELLEYIIKANSDLLDQYFESWHGLYGWGPRPTITIDAEFDTGAHKEIAEWFTDVRGKIKRIEDDLVLSK